MKLAVLSHVFEKFHRAVEPICRREGIALVAGRSPGELAPDALRGVTMVLADPPFGAEALVLCPDLVWMQSTWAGLDGIFSDDTARERARVVPVTGLRGVHGPVIAEYVAAYVLAIHRNLFVHREEQKERVWKFRTYEKLRGREACFLGTGAIAGHVARRLEAMGFVCSGVNRSGRGAPAFGEVRPFGEHEELLARAHVVVALLPLTDATRGLVDERCFRAMANRPLFVNVGRGPTVVEADLLSAMDEGRLSGAVLDVFEHEPLPADSPLWSREGVYVTPHVAGITFVEDIVEVWEENLHRHLRGDELIGVVDPDRGY